MTQYVNLATIKTDFEGVVNRWIKFTAPMHNLTPQEQDLISQLLLQYFRLKEKIDDPELLWKMVFDYDTKAEIKNVLGWKDYTLQNLLTRLRKKGIITRNNQIAKPYIPNLSSDAKGYKIIFNFIIQ